MNRCATQHELRLKQNAYTPENFRNFFLAFHHLKLLCHKTTCSSCVLEYEYDNRAQSNSFKVLLH